MTPRPNPSSHGIICTHPYISCQDRERKEQEEADQRFELEEKERERIAKEEQAVFFAEGAAVKEEEKKKTRRGRGDRSGRQGSSARLQPSAPKGSSLRNAVKTIQLIKNARQSRVAAPAGELTEAQAAWQARMDNLVHTTQR